MTLDVFEGSLFICDIEEINMIHDVFAGCRSIIFGQRTDEGCDINVHE